MPIGGTNPLYLLGLHLTPVQAYGLTINPTTGAIVVATSVFNITPYVSEVDPSLENDLEDIRPVNRLQRNNVVTGTGSNLRVAALQRSDAANAITQILNTTFYVEFDWLEGTHESYGYQGVVRRWNGGIKNRGGNPIILELEPIDNLLGLVEDNMIIQFS